MIDPKNMRSLMEAVNSTDEEPKTCEWPDDAKKELLAKYSYSKTYRTGPKSQNLDEFTDREGATLNQQLSGSHVCTNPFSWSTYEGTTIAFMKYVQRYGGGYNTITVFCKDKKKLMELISQMDEAGVIKRPMR